MSYPAWRHVVAAADSWASRGREPFRGFQRLQQATPTSITNGPVAPAAEPACVRRATNGRATMRMTAASIAARDRVLMNSRATRTVTADTSNRILPGPAQLRRMKRRTKPPISAYPTADCFRLCVLAKAHSLPACSMDRCQRSPRPEGRRPLGRDEGSRPGTAPSAAMAGPPPKPRPRCCVPGLPFLRRWGDSNSRGASTPTSLAGRRTRPLCDISIAFPQPVPWDARAAYREDAPVGKPQSQVNRSRRLGRASSVNDDEAEAAPAQPSRQPARQAAQPHVASTQRRCETTALHTGVCCR